MLLTKGPLCWIQPCQCSSLPPSPSVSKLVLLQNVRWPSEKKESQIYCGFSGVEFSSCLCNMWEEKKRWYSQLLRLCFHYASALPTSRYPARHLAKLVTPARNEETFGSRRLAAAFAMTTPLDRQAAWRASLWWAEKHLRPTKLGLQLQTDHIKVHSCQPRAGISRV